MTLKEYLSQYLNTKTLTIVGPMSAPPTDIQEPIVYIDGGTKFKAKSVGYSVGDGDSSIIPLDEKLNPEKDFSDLGYALNQITHHFPAIELYGFLGGRRDHEIFNLGELHHFLSRQNDPTVAHFDRVWDAYSQGSWEFEIQGQFSLVSFAPAKVMLEGDCKYKIPNGTEIPTVTSFGLSNWGDGLTHMETNAPIFIYRVSEEA